MVVKESDELAMEHPEIFLPTHRDAASDALALSHQAFDASGNSGMGQTTKTKKKGGRRGLKITHKAQTGQTTPSSASGGNAQQQQQGGQQQQAGQVQLSSGQQQQQQQGRRQGGRGAQPLFGAAGVGTEYGVVSEDDAMAAKPVVITSTLAKGPPTNRNKKKKGKKQGKSAP